MDKEMVEFLDQYIDDVLNDLSCMSASEIRCALEKLERYTPAFRGTSRQAIITNAKRRLAGCLNPARKAESYFNQKAHRDDRWAIDF